MIEIQKTINAENYLWCNEAILVLPYLPGAMVLII